MPSPFPGMDPWLEDPDTFPEVHASLITYLRDALNAVLPAGYAARMKKIVWVDDEVRSEPDVSLFGPDRPAAGAAVRPLAGLLTAGTERAPEEWEEPYLEIRSDRGERLVTAVEVLSPSNKRVGGAGRKAYQEKQKEFRLGGVNVVEVDLLRGGAHTTAVPLARLRRKGACDYHVSARVAGDPARFYVGPIRLADRLPRFDLPLDPTADPVPVDLQPLLDRAYDNGRYVGGVRYDRPPDPPLTPEQQAWANGVLRAKRLIP